MIKTLADFNVYNLAMELGEEVWKIVMTWDSFQKDTVGKQFVRAADSIAANLSEGLGRYHYKESKHFSYYARGSMFETKTWITKARNRSLINQPMFEKMIDEIDIIGKMINSYISSIGEVNEPETDYDNPA